MVQKVDPDAQPVLQMVVSSPRPLREVTEIADKQIKPRLENISGVGQITIVGGLKREIRVWVDPEKMRAYDVSVSDVVKALKEQNVELPGGSVNAGATELSVRTLGRLVDPAQFDEIAVSRRGSYVVKIRDIGRAEDSEEEPTTAARLNGNPAVTLVVAKQSGENTVATADEVKARLKEIQALLPKDITIQMINDQSIFIKSAVRSLESHLVEGSILAAVIIFIFLANIRTTLISAIAIPTSIVSAFGLMAAMKLDLNQITMLALTLMVGIVIDDAIIVLENIYRYMEEKGMPPMLAAIEGTKEIGLAVMATTLSLARRISSHRLHGRRHRPLHVLLRIHRFLRHRGLAVGVLHAHADAEFALHQDAAKAAEGGSHHASKDSEILPLSGPPLHAYAGVGDGAPQIHGGAVRGGVAEHRSLIHAGRQELHPHR